MGERQCSCCTARLACLACLLWACAPHGARTHLPPCWVGGMIAEAASASRAAGGASPSSPGASGRLAAGSTARCSSGACLVPPRAGLRQSGATGATPHGARTHLPPCWVGGMTAEAASASRAAGGASPSSPGASGRLAAGSTARCSSGACFVPPRAGLRQSGATGAVVPASGASGKLGPGCKARCSSGVCAGALLRRRHSRQRRLRCRAPRCPRRHSSRPWRLCFCASCRPRRLGGVTPDGGGSAAMHRASTLTASRGTAAAVLPRAALPSTAALSSRHPCRPPLASPADTPAAAATTLSLLCSLPSKDGSCVKDPPATSANGRTDAHAPSPWTSAPMTALSHWEVEDYLSQEGDSDSVGACHFSHHVTKRLLMRLAARPTPCCSRSALSATG